jgi:hypothetical protein
MRLPPHIIALRDDAEREPANPAHLRLLADAYDDEGQDFRAAIERMAADNLEAANAREVIANRQAWRQIALYSAVFAALFAACIAGHVATSKGKSEPPPAANRQP